jgi:hypothetical protein
MDISTKLMESVNYMLTNPSIPHSHKSAGRSPSSASVKFINSYGTEETHGKCLRQAYYSAMKMEKDDIPEDPQGMRIFAYGDAIHEVEVDFRKRAGVYIADEFAFWNPDDRISGRCDVACRDLETMEIFGEELKTTNPFGIKKFETAPKVDHVLQCLVYLDWFSVKIKTMNKWVLTYVDRAFGSEIKYTIRIHDGHPVVDDEIWDWIDVRNVYDRFNLLEDYIKEETIPEPDYMMNYDRDTLIEMDEQGKLTRTESSNLKKGSKVTKGAEACKYCKYRGLCDSQRTEGGLS